ncbi:MAG: multiple sugar transport system permease protein [Actinomycetota bacterium]|jgi:multiple sugar transport system permease protein|nr:multiple sugar transport system permease protein [Actinomycetota bacterium]
MARVQAQTRTLISQAQLSRTKGKVLYWTILCIFVPAFAIVFVFPLYWMATGGLKSAQEIIQSPPTWFPHSIQWGTYVDAWRQLRLSRLLFNTTLYAGGALVFQLVFDVAAAYALSKLRPVLGNLILFMMLATLMIPATVLALPTFLTVFHLPILHLNLTNSPWAIWLPSVANGFNIFLLKRFFDSIPEELIAASAIDGAGPLRTLWSVVLPISRPILGVVSIFAVVSVWKDFLWPLLVLSDPAKQTVNIGLYELNQGSPQNVFTAALVIASIPMIVFFLIFQRNIMAGLTSGGIKG